MGCSPPAMAVLQLAGTADEHMGVERRTEKTTWYSYQIACRSQGEASRRFLCVGDVDIGILVDGAAPRCQYRYIRRRTRCRDIENEDLTNVAAAKPGETSAAVYLNFRRDVVMHSRRVDGYRGSSRLQSTTTACHSHNPSPTCLTRAKAIRSIDIG